MLDVLDLTRRLVEIESSSHMSNRPIAELIAQFCEDAGCQVSCMPYSDGKQVNVVATKGGGDPYFALSGHTDTVGFQRKKWSSDPLALDFRNGNYYGLGVADMKLALATIIVATSSVSTTQLSRPVGLYFTAQEEIGCIGAKVLVDSGIELAPYILVCEPTQMTVANRHKGYIYFSVTVKRDFDKHLDKRESRAHSSDDRLCTNVVEEILPVVLRELVEIKDHLRTINDKEFDPPYTTLNIGEIRQPDNASKNIIATEFRLHCDMRYVRCVNPSDLLALVEGKVRRVVGNYCPTIKGDTFSIEVRAVRKPTLPMITSSDSRLLAALDEVSPGSVPYNTEGGVFNAAGSQAIIMGPASIEQAHIEEEFASERWFQPDVTDRYASVIRSMCGRNSK